MILKICILEQYDAIIKTPQQHVCKHCLTCKTTTTEATGHTL